MKKFFILFIAISVFNFSFGQFKSGMVMYKVRPPQSLKKYADTTGFPSSGKRVIVRNFKQAQKAAPYISFTLIFNGNAALFTNPHYLTNDNGIDLNGAVAKTGAHGVYYTNLEKNVGLHQFKSIGDFWLVHTKLHNRQWKIGSETKTIKGYVCHNATTTVRYNFMVKGTITAWFCPELPFHYGPMGLANLPGLILGVERRHYFFYADKITFSKTSRAIKQPTGGKAVSETEFYQAAEEFSPAR